MTSATINGRHWVTGYHYDGVISHKHHLPHETYPEWVRSGSVYVIDKDSACIREADRESVIRIPYPSSCGVRVANNTEQTFVTGTQVTGLPYVADFDSEFLKKTDEKVCDLHPAYYQDLAIYMFFSTYCTKCIILVPATGKEEGKADWSMVGCS